MRPDGATRIHWRRSRRCQASNGCVDVAAMAAPAGRAIAVRDGTVPDEPFLCLTPAAWRDLVMKVKNDT
ncbi:hypothetical protein GCM10010191_80420 [Actinomadura vinacea]|uniref:DUF397 domain-containing protein n=1 Tax=Actinomadura vinacea TaxID=115336 RepID=A0ABP5XE73_9ACTN